MSRKPPRPQLPHRASSTFLGPNYQHWWETLVRACPCVMPRIRYSSFPCPQPHHSPPGHRFSVDVATFLPERLHPRAVLFCRGLFPFCPTLTRTPLLITSPFSQEYPNINMDLDKICIFHERLSLRVNPCLWLCLVTLPPTDSDQPRISSHPHFLK